MKTTPYIKTCITSVMLSLSVAAMCGCTDDASTPQTDPGPCVPTTCAENNWQCGTLSDGCGTLLSCGKCEDGYKCRLGRCNKICVPDCVGKCSGDDGCGGYCTNECSLTGQSCSSETGGCTGECVPRSCVSLKKECGEWDDWCGGTVDCGECLPGSDCESGTCSEVSAEGLGNPCNGGSSDCVEPFPDCMALVGETPFCTRECTGNGQCGKGNCCVPHQGVGRCVAADSSDYFCTNPVGSESCFNYETCLPSPLGACLFCFEEGLADPGMECTTFNSCRKGYACVKLPGDKAATCREICDPTNVNACSGSAEARHCLAEPAMGDFGLCVDGPRTCNPMRIAADCPTGWNCVPAKEDCSSFECAAQGENQLNQPCTGYGDCARGLFCVDGKCRNLCSGSEPCPDNHECVKGCSSKVTYCNPVGGNNCTVSTASTDCLAEQKCIPVNPPACTTASCFQPGTAAAGNTCSKSSDCSGGMACYNSRCSEVCSFGKTCAFPGTCVYICNNADFGICVTP